MTKPGRPKKKDAIKAGELRKGLCRFSFIASVSTVAAIKQMAAGYDMTIKHFMALKLIDLPKDEASVKKDIAEHKAALVMMKKYPRRYLNSMRP